MDTTILGSIVAFVRGKAHSSDKQNAVHGILEEALNSRSRLDIKFVDGDMAGRYMSGPCMGLREDRLLVDTNLQYVMHNWLNQRVHVFFQLSEGKKNRYYDFFSTVTGIHSYEGAYALELEMPHNLNNNQKRTFVRLTPNWPMVKDIQVWTDLTQMGLVSTPKAMPLPSCVASAVKVDNISGGGIRLLIRRRESKLNLEKEDGVFLHIHLEGPDDKNPLGLWLAGKVVFFQRLSDAMDSISLQFRAWAPDVQPEEDLSWFPVDGQGGVPPLASWVMLRHLESSRLQ